MAKTRGELLVERVIRAHTTRRLPWGVSPITPVPLAPERLASLSLPGGRALPPSLRTWLAFDARSLPLLEDLEAPQLHPQKLSTLAAALLARVRPGTAVSSEFDELLPGACFPLAWGPDWCRFLYVGQVDTAGEYPVFVLDVPPNAPVFVGLDAPGFDVFLAQSTRLLPRGERHGDVPAEFRGFMREHAERNFDGFVAWHIGSGGETFDERFEEDLAEQFARARADEDEELDEDEDDDELE
jgi:hypothetical protein